MDIIKGMTIFTEVAKQQGFAPAARELNLSTSAVSRYVIEFEAWLGVQLFQRTTRKISLTEEGRNYLDQCHQVIEDVNDIKNIALEKQTEPQGWLKLTAPVYISKECLQHILSGYLMAYPKVQIDLKTTDRFVDLVEEGIDLAIRAGDLPDSTLIARRLMDVHLTMIASPEYFEKRESPKTIYELKDHNCIVDTLSGYADHWPLYDGKKPKTIQIRGNFRVNSGEIARTLAVDGHGIALLPNFMVSEQLQEGNLISLLDNSINFKAGIFAVYPQRRFVSANVRSFIDYLVAHLDQQKNYDK